MIKRLLVMLKYIFFIGLLLYPIYMMLTFAQESFFETVVLGEEGSRIDSKDWEIYPRSLRLIPLKNQY